MLPHPKNFYRVLLFFMQKSKQAQLYIEGLLPEPYFFEMRDVFCSRLKTIN